MHEARNHRVQASRSRQLASTGTSLPQWMARRTGRLGIACLPLLLTGSVLADVPMTVTTSSFERVPLSVHKISPTEIEAVDARGQARQIALADVVAADRDDLAMTSSTGLVLHVAGGLELPGEPAGLSEAGITWHNAVLGNLTVPLATITGIGKGGERPQLARSPQDVVRLANGDVLKGILASADGRKLVLQGDQGELAVEWSAVAELSLAETTGPATAASHPGTAGQGFRISLRDGTVWVVPALTMEGDQFKAALSDGRSMSIAPAELRSLETEAGKVMWLIRQTPLAAEYAPFFSVSDVKPAAYAAMSAVQAGGQSFRSALRVRPLSRLTYAVPAGVGVLRTRYMVAGNGVLADVTVRLRLDQKVVYEQTAVKAGALSAPVIVSVAGGKAITLEVDYGANQDVQDTLLWLDPAWIRNGSTPANPATSAGQ